MEITWLGHASVCINSRDILLVTDPYDSSEGLFMPPSKAHIVLSSNSDPKHANTSSSCISLKCLICDQDFKQCMEHIKLVHFIENPIMFTHYQVATGSTRNKTSNFVKAIPEIPEILIVCLTKTPSNHPHLLFLLVTVPNSCPFSPR